MLDTELHLVLFLSYYFGRFNYLCFPYLPSYIVVFNESVFDNRNFALLPLWAVAGQVYRFLRSSSGDVLLYCKRISSCGRLHLSSG